MRSTAKPQREASPALRRRRTTALAKPERQLRVELRPTTLKSLAFRLDGRRTATSGRSRSPRKFPVSGRSHQHIKLALGGEVHLVGTNLLRADFLRRAIEIPRDTKTRMHQTTPQTTSPAGAGLKRNRKLCAYGNRRPEIAKSRKASTSAELSKRTNEIRTIVPASA